MNAKLDETFVLECRIEAQRNVSATCFAPAISRAERRHVERTMEEVLENMSDDLSGRYFSATRLTKKEEDDLQEVKTSQLVYVSLLYLLAFGCAQIGLLPVRPSGHVALSSGVTRDWPDGKAVW